ncbi:unnamed protein product [Parascedosporium putredinis]|uniref:Uncharacterized protein n=1 Tax=Parascedosporium putredinis TaxID=1442378 RepID=A0A9P1ME09_9PEZI|nr:unnamed protein product [Parascedosporium putredinis]CAI8001740.1 unnamed protein product [Parascedosporium putredinis]
MDTIPTRRQIVGWCSAVTEHRGKLLRPESGTGCSGLNLATTRVSVMEKNILRSAYLLGFQGTGSELEGESAATVLTRPENSSINLFVDSISETNSGTHTKYYTLRDRVERVLDDLVTLIDYQDKIANQDGYWVASPLEDVKNGMKRKVVGYDLKDVVSFRGVSQRVEYFSNLGYGWTQYARAIKALVIFGRGFEDLIVPVDGQHSCTQWKVVPSGQNYLCATITTLRRIQIATPGPKPGRHELHGGISWSSPNRDVFTRCHCLNTETPRQAKPTSGLCSSS